jgi:hypothetical protein
MIEPEGGCAVDAGHCLGERLRESSQEGLHGSRLLPVAHLSETSAGSGLLEPAPISLEAREAAREQIIAWGRCRIESKGRGSPWLLQISHPRVPGLLRKSLVVLQKLIRLVGHCCILELIRYRTKYKLA